MAHKMPLYPAMATDQPTRSLDENEDKTDTEDE